MAAAYGFDFGDSPQGAIFALSGAAKKDRRQTFGPWEAELRGGAPHMCLRGGSPNQNKALTTIASAAHPVAENFLDILAVEERTSLLLIEPHDNLAWRVGQHGLKVQLAISIVMVAEGPDFRAVVRDASGNVIPPPPYVPPPHHPAFRYFRYSQASQNVFDAYRSMFLALEAALDHLDPKRQGDSEKDWLRRALGSAVRRGIDLSGFVASSSKDPVEGFIDAHYAAVRCPVFHAKAAAGHVLRPGSLRDHDTVLNQLLAMQKLVEHLMKSVFLAKLPQGGFYHAGFGHLLAELAPMMGLLVCVVDCPTIDQLNVKEDNLPDGEGLPLRFEGRTSGMTDEWTFSCEMKCAALGFDRIQSLRVFAAPNNHIFLGPIADKFNRTLIKTDLNLQGISKLVVKVRCVLRNIHAPRRGFSS